MYVMAVSVSCANGTQWIVIGYPKSNVAFGKDRMTLGKDRENGTKEKIAISFLEARKECALKPKTSPCVKQEGVFLCVNTPIAKALFCVSMYKVNINQVSSFLS